MEIQVAGQNISSEEVTAEPGWLLVRSRRSTRGPNNSTLTDESTQAPSDQPRSRIGGPVVTAAILQAAKLTDEESSEDTVCPNTQQNIAVVSTTYPEHADRYVRIRYIQVNGVTHEVNAYEPAAENTTKGVIQEAVLFAIKPRTSFENASGKEAPPAKPSINNPDRVALSHPAKGSGSRSRTPSRSRQHRSRSRSVSTSRSKSTNNPQVSFADTLKGALPKGRNTNNDTHSSPAPSSPKNPETAELKRENATLRDLLTHAGGSKPQTIPNTNPYTFRSERPCP
ncbi:hypothetical protein HPB50_008348 [Hyalomma asiaticum]|uniref:Uncharacterized protein n=1 Tax=Hyalomma asiaticum TaxID=266040 RepID=A0ACB7SUC8_HYAAI|nr:hypothetical protein HPB50_008348 [Hyalomma asiaticum]